MTRRRHKVLYCKNGDRVELEVHEADSRWSWSVSTWGPTGSLSSWGGADDFPTCDEALADLDKHVFIQ